MNLNNPGRVRKRKESVKKVSEESPTSASSSGTCRGMDREMTVLPRQSYLEMRQKLNILSESK